MNELDSILFSPCKYQERFYWTFEEVLNSGSSSDQKYLTDISALDSALESMVTQGYNTPIWNSQTEQIKTEYRLVLDLVVKRFLEKYCFYTLTKEYDLNKGFNFLGKLIYILEMTSPRYLKLLEVYESEKDKLLDPVKITSEGISRFNDTPQDEGDFANDEHTTNLTEDTRKTSNELDTKMARIKEIESNYNNIILNWSNEFESIFIEEANI